MSESATIPVSLRDADGIAVVTLDDGKVNALSMATMDALEQTLTSAAESAGAIVLAGRPGMFCAGLDVKVIRGDDEVARAQMVTRIESMLGAIARVRVPIVAACTGHAIAGGALLLLASAYRVGVPDESFKIGLTEVALGMPMPDFAQHYATARLDRRVLMRATALAEVVGPARGVEWGYLDELAPADGLMDTAIDVARRLRDSVDRVAFAYTKKLVIGR